MAAGAEILKVCAEVGGSISGEHGIGLEKADYMPFIFSEADLACMHRVKDAFNPHGSLQSGQDLPEQQGLRRGRARPTVRIRSKRRGSRSGSSGPFGDCGALSVARPAAPHRRRAPRADRGGVLALRASRAARPRRWSSRARSEEVAAVVTLAGEQRLPVTPVGRRHQDVASARRRTASASCWRSSGSIASSSTSRAISPSPSRRASRSTGCRPSWASAGSGSRSIRPRPTGRRVGGILASDASGPRRHLYGTARDLVIGLTVIGGRRPRGARRRQGGQERGGLRSAEALHRLLRHARRAGRGHLQAPPARGRGPARRRALRPAEGRGSAARARCSAPT